MSSAAKSSDTKERILQAASELFARAGYEGTSIRDIAAEAQVNLAAVNYHYKNKQTLYWENYVHAIEWMEKEIKALPEELVPGELMWRIFQILLNNHDKVLNAFKLILSGSVPEPEGEHLTFCTSREAGPPCADVVQASIVRHVGSDIPEEQLQWAVKSIFSIVVHWALMAGSEYIKRIPHCGDEFTPDKMELGIKAHTDAILATLR